MRQPADADVFCWFLWTWYLLLLHFVSITRRILHGLITPPYASVDHSYTEVSLDGQWVSTDSYTVDPALHRAAVARLMAEGRHIGPLERPTWGPKRRYVTSDAGRTWRWFTPRGSDLAPKPLNRPSAGATPRRASFARLASAPCPHHPRPCFPS